MQLYAIDQNQSIISAVAARKGHSYLCLECQGAVRVRGGLFRPHFYHLAPVLECRQSGKSFLHLQIQKWIQEKLPKEEARLEVRFPTIKRVADVVWDSQKIIFEVQVSPISKMEVQKRILDYTSLGYTLVFLFHENRFGKLQKTGGEKAAFKIPHYYTDLDEEGRGGVYDVCTFETGDQKRFLVDLKTPEKTKFSHKKLPKALKFRLQHWKLFFKGDALSYEEEYWATIVKKEKNSARISFFKKVFDKLFFFYKIGFRALLEACCK